MKKYAMVPVETGKFIRMLMKAKTKDGELFWKIAGSGNAAIVLRYTVSHRRGNDLEKKAYNFVSSK
jgi:hypothetical protein